MIEMVMILIDLHLLMLKFCSFEVVLIGSEKSFLALVSIICSDLGLSAMGLRYFVIFCDEFIGVSALMEPLLTLS